MHWKKFLISFALAATIGCGSSSTSVGGAAPAAAAVPVEESVRVLLTKPAPRRLADEIALSGVLAPFEQVTVYSRVDGYLKSIGHDIGDRVSRGDLLAEIDVPEMTAELDERRAGIARAEAALEQAKAEVRRSEAEQRFEILNHERLAAIRARNQDVLPQHEVDRAAAGADVAAGRLEKARADVKAARAAIEAAKADLTAGERMAEFSRLTAPISGVVTERFIDPGDLVQAAASSRTQAAPIVALANLDSVRVLIDVPEPQAPLVKRGTPATVRVAGLEPIEAAVTRTGGVLNPATRTLRAEIHLPNPRGALRAGMTADVDLALRTVEEALTTPVSAVRGEGGRYWVFVADGERARRREVRIGMESPQWIQIVSGLTADELIVESASGDLRDGSRLIALDEGGRER